MKISVKFMGLILIVLAWRERASPARRLALAASALGVWLMIAFGPFGWFYRYEVCVRVFAVLILVGILCGQQRISVGRLAASLTLVGAPYFAAIFLTPIACTRIYRQQFQMHRLADDFYEGSVAVNDLGWVSFGHGDKSYVLDLFGLGSREAATQADKSTTWMAEIVRRHDVGLVMIYSVWFAPPPAAWTPIAVLHQRTGLFIGSIEHDAVSFYATPQSDVPAMRRLVEQFAKTLPPETWITAQ